MLQYSPAHRESQPKAATAAKSLPAAMIAVAARAPDPPAVPFARFPHALAADRRLSPTDRLVACALLFWAMDRPAAEMSNRALAGFVGVSLATVERSIRALVALGYLRTEAVRPTAANMTGRVVHLLWLSDPSILPAVPPRATRATTPPRPDPRGLEHPDDVVHMVATPVARPAAGGTTLRGTLAGEGTPAPEPPSSMRGPAPQPCGTPPLIAEGAPPSPVRGKGDRVVKKPENPETARADGSGRQRRPRPDVQPPGPVDAAVLDARHLAALTAHDPGGQGTVGRGWASDAHPCGPARHLGGTATAAAREVGGRAAPPKGVDPADTLTAGQRAALGAMSDDQRRAFEAKSPGVRAQVLAPFAGGFDAAVFDRVTRSLLVVPRFVAQAQPPDRSTPGLLAAVAGGDPRLVGELAEALCRELGGAGDRRRWGALFALAGQVLDREVTPEAVLDALRQAKGPKATNPGAVFTHALKAHGWRPRGS